MTSNQFKDIAKKKFHPAFAKLVNDERISLANASIAIQISPADQMLFAFQAQVFSQQAFAAAVNQWLKMDDDRRTIFRVILDDLDSAFDQWDASTGNQGTPELMEEYEQMVKEARARVMAYIHRLEVPLPDKIE